MWNFFCPSTFFLLQCMKLSPCLYSTLMRILCCIKSFALVIFPFKMPTATILYNYNMLTCTSTTYAQIRFQMTKSWASASNAFTLNLDYLLALCHWEINKCLLLSDDADITWQTPSCTPWCRDRNELHILIHPKTNFSTQYHSGTQRLSYHGYERQDHPMKSSVTHSVTNSHTHIHNTKQQGGGKWVEESIQSQCSSISWFLLGYRRLSAAESL